MIWLQFESDCLGTLVNSSYLILDLKIGMSETSVFDVYHPQAKELYSVTSDLKKVCEKLQDPFARIGKSVSVRK
jgi:hypothetical protein